MDSNVNRFVCRQRGLGAEPVTAALQGSSNYLYKGCARLPKFHTRSVTRDGFTPFCDSVPGSLSGSTPNAGLRALEGQKAVPRTKQLELQRADARACANSHREACLDCCFVAMTKRPVQTCSRQIGSRVWRQPPTLRSSEACAVAQEPYATNPVPRTAHPFEADRRGRWPPRDGTRYKRYKSSR